MIKGVRLVGFAIVLTVPAYTVFARDYISIVGSSTVYPFATVVAENFGKTTRFKTPKIESTGSGGGLKLFCAGVGVEHPDIANASRRIKQSELDTCRKNGVSDIVEVTFGFDGIAVANAKSRKYFSFSLKDLYLALAKTVPDSNGALIPNPYKTWKDVNPRLPSTNIEVFGPPPTSGTRDAFSELAMEGGCKTIPSLAVLKKTDEKTFATTCTTMREDGAYIEAGENDNLIVQKLVADPNSLGIFGFSYLDQNKDKIQGSRLNGKIPDLETIADGSYPLSRPLFFYIKKAHVPTIPGIKQYVREFMNDKAIGDYGYLVSRGLIPMPTSARKKAISIANKLITLKKL